MAHTYLILGAGSQGAAVAYDVALYGDAKEIILADRSLELARTVQTKLHGLTQKKITIEEIDVQNPSDLKELIKRAEAILSALPYYLNPWVAKWALDCGVSYCDLGGYFESTQAISNMHLEAKKKGVTLIPDCGVSPGMCNTLAVCGMNRLDAVESVFLYCGGLPQKPVGPLGYKMVFNLEGVLGNYFGKAYILRNGKIVEAPPLSQRECVDFGPPLGKLEAAITGGATSSCPWTFKGKVKDYVYKTLRYLGHFEKVDLLTELGFLDENPVEWNGSKIIPRKFFAQLAGEKIRFEDVPDILVLKVIVRGEKGGMEQEVVYDVLDNADSKTGFSAMQRTTGFSGAIVLEMLAQGVIQERGFAPVERSVPPEIFLREIRRRGIQVKETSQALIRGGIYAKV